MAQINKLLIVILLLTANTNIQAQTPNPFQSIGKKAKIKTAYGGRFDEFFDYDSIQRVGSVLMNIYTKKIVRLLDVDKVFLEFSDNSSSSRWYSVDPLADQQIQWSPYHFAYDNPIRYNDPDGRIPGDFYDQQGNKIGSDGKADQKVYVVTDQKEVQSAQKSTAKGKTLDADKMKSDILLPSEHVRTRMGEAVDRSNNPSTAADDATGGMHEEGGYYGTNASGQEIAIRANPGEAYVEGTSGVGVKSNQAGDQYDASYRSQDNKEGTFHVHPKGDGKTAFVQPPSGADLRNSVSRGLPGNNYVLGAGNNTVYIYKPVNGTGTVIATFPLNTFITVKAK